MHPPVRREVIPLSSLSSEQALLPHTRTRILGKPVGGPLTLEQLFISGAGTPSGAADWIIHDIEIDGVSQLSMKDLSGALFSPKGIAAGDRATSGISFSGLAVIERESEIAVTVSYVGPHPNGVPFFGSIVGETPPQRPTILPIATRLPCALVKKRANRLLNKITISVALDAPLKIESLRISEHGTSGGSGDWVVEDLRVDGITQFAQEGGVPGDMFATNAIDDFVEFQPGKKVEIDVSYIGLRDEGIPFACQLLGTVMRDDYNQPPPDVHAIVRASNDPTLEEPVVGRCNWRVPYVPATNPAT